MSKKFWLILIAIGFLFGAEAAFAQDSFYRGKVLRIIVGFPAGGGYDTYSRFLSRHMGKFIAGNPTIVVENMSGAGSMIFANHIFRVAKADGLTMGHFIGGLFLQQILGKPGIEFDARKFEYIGAPAQDVFLIGVSKASGITSVQQWLASKTVVKFGGAGFGAGTDDIPALIREVMGCRFNWSPATRARLIFAWRSTLARSTASATHGSRCVRPGARSLRPARSISSYRRPSNRILS
jgi:tripartite-type tricarboxylate transporter receptor subunit TctC